MLEAQAGGSENRTVFSRDNKPPVRPVDGSKPELRTEKQVTVEGDENFAAAGEGKDVSASACRCSRMACPLISKTLSYLDNSGLEALRRHMESVEDGSASLGQLGALMDLQVLKSVLTKLKEDVDSGIRRIEEVMGPLVVDGLITGLGAGQCLGHVKDVGYTLKPKRKNRRRRKKKTRRSSGPKPGTSLISDSAGTKPTRVEMRPFQVGESFEAGAARAAGVSGSSSQLLSILGKFE